MKNDEELKKLFPQTVRGMLEGGGPNDDPPYVSYDDGPRGSQVSESPRLVATYKLVKIELQRKVMRLEVIRKRKRRQRPEQPVQAVES